MELTVGLEIHQQLDTGKLFCSCPSILDEREDLKVLRKLRPTRSELGEIDKAAVAESEKGRIFEYVASRTTSCLVELDEEPPHPMNPEALEVGLVVADLLGMRVLDEIHVMRKIVLDGSNTTGFQRTALLAIDGRVETSKGPVRIETLCLEEDSARKVDAQGSLVRYRLDRLGIPLLEISTAPDIHDPHQAREAARKIGEILRSTGRVKRGIGTIRQDLNVSIPGGARVELKGVQDLGLIPVALDEERRRQRVLSEISLKLRSRGAKVEETIHDVSDLIQEPLGAWAIALRGFAGLLGKKDPSHPSEPRLGKELSEYARVRTGVGGILHSDELPSSRISEETVEKIRLRLRLRDDDAFVLVRADPELGSRALRVVAERASWALVGVPEETREVLEDGSSRYLRPLPGGARMYPETDLPPIRIPKEELQRILERRPETWEEKERRWVREFRIGPSEASALVRSQEGELFERLARSTGRAKEASRLLLQILPELEKEGIPRNSFGEELLEEALRLVSEGVLAKEALPDLLREVQKSGGTPRGVLERLGIARLDPRRVEEEVERVLEEKKELVLQKGEASLGALMGILMSRLRGRVEGEVVSQILREKIRKMRLDRGS